MKKCLRLLGLSYVPYLSSFFEIEEAKVLLCVQSRLSEMSSVQWNASPHSERKADGLDRTAGGESLRVKGEGQKLRSVEDVEERVRQVSRV